MSNQNIEMARQIARLVADAGGRTYFVGGFVRDRLLGIENKDVDIEVHGITPGQLEAILDSLGERTVMGVSFGVFGLRHYDLDIAMPRSETATGRGHKDFEVFVDPFIGAEKAALRRDFTINALMQDVLTDEILDFFGGQEDIRLRRIVHVNDSTFVEDPLRVFRAAQFAARFQFETAPETVALCQTMDVAALSKERVMGELEKALLKSQRPSVFFTELQKMDQLYPWFKEFAALPQIEQSPDHHPEGNVWNHTMQVLDAAAMLREKAMYPLPFMLSALCHDLGKITATAQVKGKIHAYGHESEGVPIAQTFLTRLTSETDVIKYVLNMTQMHMEPNLKIAQGSKVKSFMNTFDRSVCPHDLLLLAKADHLGRQADGISLEMLEEDYQERSECLQKLLETYNKLMAEPQVMGRDLQAAGFKPSPLYSDALRFAHKLHLSGISKDSALKQTISYLKKLERVKTPSPPPESGPNRKR